MGRKLLEWGASSVDESPNDALSDKDSTSAESSDGWSGSSDGGWSTGDGWLAVSVSEPSGDGFLKLSKSSKRGSSYDSYGSKSNKGGKSKAGKAKAKTSKGAYFASSSSFAPTICEEPTPSPTSCEERKWYVASLRGGCTNGYSPRGSLYDSARDCCEETYGDNTRIECRRINVCIPSRPTVSCCFLLIT